MTILVFDLDDTIYEEFSFVKSGYKAVSEYLSFEFNISASEIYEKMLLIYKSQGRSLLFNKILEIYGVSNRKILNKLIQIYRTHIPDLELNEEVKELLLRLSCKYSLYIVTDGNRFVQQRKIDALMLESFFKKIFITRNYGLKAEKPSLHCFKKILSMEKSDNWSDLIYVGDNPNKDFIKLKEQGSKTIRINNGLFKNIKFPIEYEAHVTINSIVNLESVLKNA